MAVAEGVEAPALAQPKARQACLICQCVQMPDPTNLPGQPPVPPTDLRAAPVLCTGASAKASVVVLDHQAIPGGCPARQAHLPPELPEPPSQLPSGGCTASSHQRFRSVHVVGDGSLESALLLGSGLLRAELGLSMTLGDRGLVGEAIPRGPDENTSLNLAGRGAVPPPTQVCSSPTSSGFSILTQELTFPSLLPFYLWTQSCPLPTMLLYPSPSPRCLTGAEEDSKS